MWSSAFCTFQLHSCPLSLSSSLQKSQTFGVAKKVEMLGFFSVHPFSAEMTSASETLETRQQQSGGQCTPVLASICKDIFCVIRSNQLVGQFRQLVRQLGAVGWIGQLLPSAKMTFASSHRGVRRHLGDTEKTPGRRAVHLSATQRLVFFAKMTLASVQPTL